MRLLALALAAVVSARQDHLCEEDVCFYHVPKTSGDSFKYLLRDELKARGRSFWSNEWCPRQSNGMGQQHGKYGLATRDKVYAECRDAANATCAVFDPRDMEHKCGFATIHRSAIFCFEPGGDSPYRKGFYDAMLAGCIPVIFSLQNELVTPWFVPKGVAVRLSERAYGNGTFKALDVLRRIPSEEIRRRQSIIRKHGHRLQYAVDDLGEEPDAVETLFVGALGLAHDLAHLYQV